MEWETLLTIKTCGGPAIANYIFLLKMIDCFYNLTLNILQKHAAALSSLEQDRICVCLRFSQSSPGYI